MMTNLIISFEPQEFARPPSNAISIFGNDDKAKAGCVRDVTISNTGWQSICTIVAEGQAPSASDQEFNTEHLIPSVTHRMNITGNTGGSLYSNGNEGGGRLYVSVHDATFDLSTCIKHTTNLLRVMRNIIGTNESLCTFYFVGLETDGGGNHNHKHVRNQIALFGVFILGDM